MMRSERCGSVVAWTRMPSLLPASLCTRLKDRKARPGAVVFANTDRADDPFFCVLAAALLRVDESRLRVRVYLHEGSTWTLLKTHWSASYRRAS